MDRNREAGSLKAGMVRPMANPLTPDVLVDPVVLTRALVDVQSVSRDEKEIADYVHEVLQDAQHLSTDRLGNTLMARTDLGRGQRVVLAGHLDTVPINDNFPSTVVDDLIYGCGTSDMKSGVALALHLAATLPDPCYDLTFLFYEAEEIETNFNGLHLVSQTHPEWLLAPTSRCCSSRPTAWSRQVVRALFVFPYARRAGVPTRRARGAESTRSTRRSRFCSAFRITVRARSPSMGVRTVRV